MPRILYDTRFFVDAFFSDSARVQTVAKEFVTRNKERYISIVTLHELYFLELSKRGREIAKLRVRGIEDVFRVMGVNSEVAINAAEIRLKYKVPMGDSLIAATCKDLDAQCVTDDPHITEIKEIKTCWV